LIVLVIVAGIYIQDAIEFITTHSQVTAQRAYVQRLARDNAALRRQQQSLNDPVTIKHDARVLGMIQSGERPYVVMGLQNH
jgi:cell division protein FtsB